MIMIIKIIITIITTTIIIYKFVPFRGPLASSDVWRERLGGGRGAPAVLGMVITTSD